MAAWFQGPAREFTRASREGFERGVAILRLLRGISVDLVEDRAISRTKRAISQHAVVEGIACDVVRTGPFCDFLVKRAGRWGGVLRRRALARGHFAAMARIDVSGAVSHARLSTAPSPPHRTR